MSLDMAERPVPSTFVRHRRSPMPSTAFAYILIPASGLHHRNDIRGVVSASTNMRHFSRISCAGHPSSSHSGTHCLVRPSTHVPSREPRSTPGRSGREHSGCTAEKAAPELPESPLDRLYCAQAAPPVSSRARGPPRLAGMAQYFRLTAAPHEEDDRFHGRIEVATRADREEIKLQLPADHSAGGRQADLGGRIPADGI